MLPAEPEGRRVVVTGAAGGIGTAVVEHLLAVGCAVTAVDLSFSAWPAGAFAGVHTVTCDLSEREAPAAAIEDAARQMGGIDALVHAAAILDNLHRAQRFSGEDWDREMNINLDAAFRAVQAAYPHLSRSGGGRVVLVSSIAAELGQPGQVAYSASKAALLGMMRTLAVEWGADGITCNAVVPGIIDTPKVARLPGGVRDAHRERIPLARFGSPEEVAGVIAFLLSPAAAYLTGTTVRVDGGFGLNMLSLAGGTRMQVPGDGR